MHNTMRGERAIRAMWFVLAVAFATTAQANGIDTTFGTLGRVVFESLGDAQVSGAILQRDGKIVLVGTTPAAVSQASNDALRDMLVIRCDPNGSLDPTFGSEGVVKIDFNGNDDRATSIVELPEGKLLVAGQTLSERGDFDFAFARLNADGSLDQGFAEDGKQSVDFDLVKGASIIVTTQHADDRVRGVIPLPNGKLLAFGASYCDPPDLPCRLGDGSTGTIRLSRLHANGSVDVDYEPDSGRNFGLRTDPTDAFLASDGNVTVISYGSAMSFEEDGSAISLIPTVGAHPNGGYFGLGTSALLQADGRLVLAGQAVSGSRFSTILGRLDRDFMLDDAFGNVGLADAVLGEATSYAVALEQEPNGKLLVFGGAARPLEIGAAQNAVIARLSRDGIPDVNFGSGGIMSLDFDEGGAELSFFPAALLRAGDGRLILVGTRAQALSTQFSPWAAPVPGTQRIAMARITSTPQFAFSQLAVSVSESRESVSIDVKRLGQTDDSVTIDYATQPGSAGLDDFSSTSGSLTWKPSDPETKTIVIPIVYDTLGEPSEQFSVRLANPSEGSIDSAALTVTILDSEVSAGKPKTGGGGATDVLLIFIACSVATARLQHIAKRLT